ncbi:hypothetical protein H2248_011020 [Termitomyces sp. 'cryptogamus']|nr:hypothetical protein H2248_011020 [Termitomyces sp. 'cryptogamus']
MYGLPHEVWLHVGQFVPASRVLRDGDGVPVPADELCVPGQQDAEECGQTQVEIRSSRGGCACCTSTPSSSSKSSTAHVPSRAPRRSLRLRFVALANQLIGAKPPRRLQTAEDIVQAMLEVFAGLPNVTDYHIMWSGLQPTAESPVPFLAAVFRSNLRKLALDISLDNIAQLLDPCSAPHSIEELELVIRVDHGHDDDDDDDHGHHGHNAHHGHHGHTAHHTAHILAHHLAPSIVRLRHSLRRLAIQAWEPLDFAPLFHALAHLPLLAHLTLAIPIESPYIGDPAGLAAFLRRQSLTLRSLSLRATQYSCPKFPPGPVSFASWLASALDDVRIPHLRTLDISSALFPLSAALVVLSALGRTIKHLHLTGSFHEYTHVQRVLATLSASERMQRLDTLRLGTVRLTPDLVDLLAHELPGLTSLEMLVREVAVDELIYPSQPPIMPPADLFCTEMQKREYPDWNLHHLSIVYTSCLWRYHYGNYIEQLLATCVPSIRPT